MSEEKSKVHTIRNIIIDYPNTYRYAVYKLFQWGYEVSAVDDDAGFFDHAAVWIAEKDGKRYAAKDPLRLLGLVAMIQEYGEDWEHSGVARSFTLGTVGK